jgi:hypothetical protein
VHLADILTQLKTALTHAQEQQTIEANKSRRPHNFQEGDMVFISSKNLPLTYANDENQGHRKTLQHKYVGEFELGKQYGENAFEVLLPQHWRLSRIFNVSQLKKSTVDRTRPQAPPPPLRTEKIGGVVQASWAIEKIVGWRQNLEAQGRIEYEVKWEGFDELTWEPEESFKGGGTEVLEEFKNNLQTQIEPQTELLGG